MQSSDQTNLLSHSKWDNYIPVAPTQEQGIRWRRFMYNFLNTEPNLRYFSMELGNEGNSHTNNLGPRYTKINNRIILYILFTKKSKLIISWLWWGQSYSYSSILGFVCFLISYSNKYKGLFLDALRFLATLLHLQLKIADGNKYKAESFSEL